MVRPLRSTASLFAVMISLAACGGSGGSGGESLSSTPVSQPSTPTSAPAPAPAPTPAPAPGPSPDEFAREADRSWAYKMVGGDKAFAAGADGAGTTIALIDSGVSDSSLVDFNRDMHSDSATIVDGVVRRGVHPYGGYSRYEHGNAIANILVADRDGKNDVGVAPNAQLLSVNVDGPNADGGYEIDDVRAGIVHADNAGADVINFSLGSRGPIEEVRAVVANATQNGTIFVTSSGNTFNGGMTYPAAHAGDPSMNGLLLAVGSVDRNKQLSWFSAVPSTMAQAEFTIVAPGEEIPSRAWHNGRVDVLGTSYASPFVAGAVAALKSKYLFMTPQEIVQLILTTAEDLGAPGTDLVYGRGLLDLEAAVQPVGTLSVVSPSGVSQSVDATQLSLGQAFGDALADAMLVNRALGVDEFGRAFAANLGTKVDRAALPSFLSTRLAQADASVQQAGARLFGGTLQITGEAPIEEVGHTSYFAEQASDTPEPALFWQSDRTAIGTISAGLNLQAEQTLFGSGEQSGLFLGQGDLLNPVASLSGNGRGFKLEGQSLGFALHQGSNEHGETENLTLQTRLGLNEFASLTHSLVLEENGGMASSGSGAFGGFGEGATSNFVSLKLNVAQSGWNFGAELTGGVTDMGGNNEVLSNWSSVPSSAFSLHATRNGIFDENDRFGVLFGQPLRVEGGSVDVTLPVEQQADGSLSFATDRLNLTPTGRESRLELAYERDIEENITISPFLLLRHEPGHMADADDEAIGGVRKVIRW